MGCTWFKVCEKVETYDILELSPEWKVTLLTDIDYQNFFTSEESNILISRWRYLMESKKSKKFGKNVFAKFFLYAPETQNFFFPVHHKGPISQYDLQRYPVFQSHIRRVINGIDYIISIMHCPDEFARHLKRLREFHHQYSSMKMIYGEIFIKTFDDAVAGSLGKLYTPEFRTVFREFMTLLYSVIFEGLESDVEKSTTNTSTVTTNAT